MEKTKRLSLGVRKRRSKKRLLNKVVDYLKSDSYMFAALVNSGSHQKIKFSSASGLEMKEPAVRGKNKKFLEKIVDYMKSDSYLYAPLITPQPVASSSKGSVQFVRKVNMKISRRTVTIEGNKPIIQSGNVITEDKFFEGRAPGSQPLAQRELIKSMVYPNCRTSSLSGMLDSRLKDLLLD